MLCTNRPEGFGPLSHLYPHILTSCFLDTILVPLCTWLYLLTLIILYVLSALKKQRSTTTDRENIPSTDFKPNRPRTRKDPAGLAVEVDTEDELGALTAQKRRRHQKFELVLSVLYYLLLAAQFLMCVLEIARLSLAELGIGLLPFTFVTLIVAGGMRTTSGLWGRAAGWQWANVGVWIALVVCDGAKIAEETKEGVSERKGTKYPESDEVIDVAVMVGIYVALGVLEIVGKWAVIG